MPASPIAIASTPPETSPEVLSEPVIQPSPEPLLVTYPTPSIEPEPGTDTIAPTTESPENVVQPTPEESPVEVIDLAEPPLEPSPAMTVTDSVEPVTEPPTLIVADSTDPTVESSPALNPIVTSYPPPATTPVTEATPTEPVSVEPSTINDVPSIPSETIELAGATNIQNLNTALSEPISVAVPEPVVFPPTPALVEPAPFVQPLPASEPVMVTYPQPSVAEPAVERPPTAPIITEPPIPNNIPAAATPSASPTAEINDETDLDSAI